MTPVKIHQIHYDEASRLAVDPQFIALDNSDNPRPDWREYWPIRQFLLSHTLDENTYYGFVSPKFGAKTGLSGAQAIAFAAASDRDVVIFSPFVEQASFFLNVFEHGESNHPGLLPAMQQFVEQAGLQIDLARVVCDHSRSIFSNYFVAKPAFWREWFRLGEALFTLCESQASPLAQAMVERAQYHQASGEVGIKVFIMERLASLVLVTSKFSSLAYDPFALTRTGIAASYLDEDM
ncbi:MAG: hypothetical protein ABI605_20210, partial [Rhizobacter sp.]